MVQVRISPKIISISFGVLVLAFLIGFYIFAWTEPGQTPPGGNVEAPLNVGSAAQTKAGRLTLPELYLNASGSEGNIYRINQLIGYNDIFIKGNIGETAPVYLAGSQLSVYTSGTERMRITSTGNVGIGTTNPGYKLTVNGPMGTPNMNHPYLVLDSSGSGSNTNEQSAQISLGESGRGNASLHLAYIGNGYSYIGMGSLGGDNIPDHWALRFYYQNDDTYAHNNINANDVYIRAASKWASQLGAGTISGSGSTNYIPKWTGSTALGNSVVYEKSNKIGIGTTNPGEKLDVQGQIHASGDICTDVGGGKCIGTFGDASQWSNYPAISDVDFVYYQSLRQRLQNSATHPNNCNSSRIGQIYYNTDLDGICVCKSTGWDCPSVTPGAPGDKIVFVTSELYTGHIIDPVTSKEGLEGANAICDRLGKTIPGYADAEFAAWLSVGGIANAKYNIQCSNSKTYRRMDYKIIANDCDDLLDGTIDNAILFKNNGQIAMGANTIVWTGTEADGTLGTDGNCEGWTVGGTTNGTVGSATDNLSSWSHSGWSPEWCKYEHPFYCFQR